MNFYSPQTLICSFVVKIAKSIDFIKGLKTIFGFNLLKKTLHLGVKTVYVSTEKRNNSKSLV